MVQNRPCCSNTNFDRLFLRKPLAGWNADNMFFLTRDGDIKIVHSETDPVTTIDEPALFHYANQCCFERPFPKESVDVFGRNYTDKLFIRLCEIVYCLAPYLGFKSLTCKKVDDQYVVRLELRDETLEMELGEMVRSCA